ncbi:MAG: hypothetical protein ACTSUS_09470 [Candidatus Freyarchaeota archaeon]
MSYPPQHGFPTHKECANFQRGVCLLSGITVDPNGPVCPNFTPKITPQIAKTYPAGQQPRLQQQASSSLLPQQSTYYPQQHVYLPSYVPYSWQAYGYPFHSAYSPSYMYPQAPYGWEVTPWYAPFPYPEYGYQAPGYGYQPYYTFPFPQFVNEELRMLEAYRDELQAEIEAVDARIRELRGQLGAWRRP